MPALWLEGGVIMATVVVEQFTYADIAAMPGDGYRHELLDGAILVTPSPGLAHQDVVLNLVVILRDHCRGTGLHVVVGPFDVRLSDTTVVVPDIVVAPWENFGDRDLRSAPRLVVEVRSRLTATIDATVKRALYESAGVQSYWLVDPARPAITMLELADGRYEARGHAVGSETLEVGQPFNFSLAPSQLLQH